MPSLGEPRDRTNQSKPVVRGEGAYKVGDFKDENGNLESYLLVEKGTDSNDAVKASDGSLTAVGWVEDRVKDREIFQAGNSDGDTYDADDILTVGAGGYRMAECSEALAEDALLVAAANGQVRAYKDQTDTAPDDPAAIVGRACESTAGANELLVIDANVGDLA